MQGLIAAGAYGDWSFGGSILTFAFPMILFIAVAGALYAQFTKPHLVPGHRYSMIARAAVATPPVTPPGQAGRHAASEGGPPGAASTDQPATGSAGQDS